MRAPDPAQAVDIAEFGTLLAGLAVWAGSPSHRELAKRAGPLLRPPQTLSKSTISELFKPSRRRLNLDLVVAVVRALGLDEAAVGRWRAACVRVHAAAKTGGPVGVFRQLPPDLATFTGREEELAHLVAAAAPTAEGRPGAKVLVFEGMAGIGKTRLAVRLAHELLRAGQYADAQLFVNLRGFDPEQAPADPSAVLDALLRQLEVPAAHIPAGRDERAAMFRDRLHGKRALLLLDDAAGEDQVTDLLPAEAACLVLVTSRRSLSGLDGAVPHRSGLFSPAEALALLARIAGTDRVGAEPAAAARVAELCGHLPLAVALVAARLRSRPAWRVSDLLADLHQAGLNGLRTGGRDVSTILHLSYANLPQPTQDGFRLLSLHPGDDLSVGAAAALAGTCAVETQAILEYLLDEHLLQQTVVGRYKFHDLVRLHGRQLAAEDPEDVRGAALIRLMDHYRQAASAAVDVLIPYERARRPEVAPPADVDPVAFADEAAAESWLHAELAAVVQTVEAVADGPAAAATRGHISDLSAILVRYLEMRSLHSAALVLHHSAAATPAGLTPGRRADIDRGLGVTYWRLGRVRESTDHYERALAGYQAAGNPGGMAAVSGTLGLIALHQGRPRSALVRFRQSRALFAQAGDPVGESRALGGLGNHYRRTGRYADALACYDQAIDLVRDTAEYSDAAGSAYANRGITRIRLGDYARARDDLYEGVAVLHLGGYRSLADEALIDLGIVHLRLDRPEEALAYLTRAVDLCRGNGHPPAEGWALLGLAEARHAAGRPAEALDLAREALALADTFGEHAVRIHAHNHLGRAEAALGRLDAAAKHHRTALDLTLTVGDPYQRAKALDGLAEVHRLRAEPDPAAENRRLASRIYRRLGVPEGGVPAAGIPEADVPEAGVPEAGVPEVGER